MSEKFSKIINVIKKDGFLVTIVKTWKYIIAKYGYKLNIFSKLYYRANRKKYEQFISDILNTNKFNRIIIMKNNLGWNIPLFQRPQHIAKKLADNGCMVFYEVTSMTDKVKTIKKISENLYLINVNNLYIQKLLVDKIKLSKYPKYLDCYSTDYKTPVSKILEYINNGFKIIYEYIDDMSPLIVGTDEIPKNMKEKYDYSMKDTKNVFIVVTADRLKDDVISKRNEEKLVLSCNGVDYDHFKNVDKNYLCDEKFSNIVKENKSIIGYYGALASWMDYEMLKYLAENRQDYNIVLLGVKYDDSYKKSNIEENKNIFFLGNKDYNVLQNYAQYFDVCVIPFKINEITKATSPVKLFEYMAMEKPIVTTDMDECKKYESVYKAKNNDEFLKLIDQALKQKDNEKYRQILRKEALENTWDMKAKKIIELLEKYE